YVRPDAKRLDGLRLDFNENLRGPSPKVMEAVAKVPRINCSCYPEPDHLIQALSRFLGVARECLLPTNGSDEAISAVFEPYVDKGESVILLSPSYDMYALYANITGAHIHWIAYREDFQFPLEEILQAIQPDTRLVVLANPNNPTGTLISRESLLRIVEANPHM